MNGLIACNFHRIPDTAQSIAAVQPSTSIQDHSAVTPGNSPTNRPVIPPAQCMRGTDANAGKSTSHPAPPVSASIASNSTKRSARGAADHEQSAGS